MKSFGETPKREPKKQVARVECDETFRQKDEAWTIL